MHQLKRQANMLIPKEANSYSIPIAGEYQAVKDWNRWSTSADAKITIDSGPDVKEQYVKTKIEKEQDERDKEEGLKKLKTFFREKIAAKVQNPEDKEKIVEFCLQHLHQGALTHAPVNRFLEELRIHSHGQYEAIGCESLDIHIMPTEEGFMIDTTNKVEGVRESGLAESKMDDDSFELIDDPILLFTRRSVIKIIDGVVSIDHQKAIVTFNFEAIVRPKPDVKLEKFSPFINPKITSESAMAEAYITRNKESIIHEAGFFKKDSKADQSFKKAYEEITAKHKAFLTRNPSAFSFGGEKTSSVEPSEREKAVIRLPIHKKMLEEAKSFRQRDVGDKAMLASYTFSLEQLIRYEEILISSEAPIVGRGEQKMSQLSPKTGGTS